MKIILNLFSFLIISCAVSAQTSPSSPPQKPVHKATIAGKMGGSTSKNELLNSKGLIPVDKTHRITEFKLTIVNRENDEIEFFNDKSGELTENMRAEIKGAESGNKVLFENIKCLGADSVSHLVNPLTFIIK